MFVRNFIIRNRSGPAHGMVDKAAESHVAYCAVQVLGLQCDHSRVCVGGDAFSPLFLALSGKQVHATSATSPQIRKKGRRAHRCI